jgi:tripartite ATP-independent transporter DctP family solute receptor
MKTSPASLSHTPSLPRKSAVPRRALVAAAAALPLVAILRRPANAAQFTLKMADGQEPNHPVNVRAREAIEKIAKATSGAVEIKLFPNAQLGADPDVTTQLRSGGVDLINMGSDVLTTLVPPEAILNIGFAFADYGQVWKAMDGGLGAYLAKRIEAVGLLQLGRSWDNGFRQITSATHPITDAASLHGFKIRVPPAPMLTSLFTALGASPAPVNFNELYSALQTHLVDGEENALPIIATAKLNEVQKYCSMTNHSWSAYLILANAGRFRKMPQNFQDIITQAFDEAAIEQRQDIAALSDSLRKELADKGLVFNDAPADSFRAMLRSGPYYHDWKAKLGAEPWKLLEDAVGSLG